MKLLVISPDSTTEHAIAWIELPVQEGSIIIQRGHEPMIVKLNKDRQIVIKLKTGKQKNIQIHSGVAEVSREAVTLVVQLA